MPFDLSQPKGTELIMTDADISGQNRFWVNRATFLRVNFHDNAEWAGGLGSSSNGGLLTVCDVTLYTTFDVNFLGRCM